MVERIPMIKLWAANFLKMCHSVLKAVSKSKTGRKIARIPEGFAVLIKRIDQPSMPNSLWYMPKTIPEISNIGLQGICINEKVLKWIC